MVEVNAHTHLGDSIAKDAAVGLSLEAAVAPPDSLKHRRLAAADRPELVTAMRRTLRFMGDTGTVSCLDFRESGVAGARVHLGRPHCPAPRSVLEGTFRRATPTNPPGHRVDQFVYRTVQDPAGAKVRRISRTNP
jgi:hypothetical protein